MLSDTHIWVFFNTLVWVSLNTLIWVFHDTLVWVFTSTLVWVTAAVPWRCRRHHTPQYLRWMMNQSVHHNYIYRQCCP